MKNLLKTGGNITAILGILICLISGSARAIGQYYVTGFEAMTLFNVGTALMVAAILIKVDAHS